MPVMVYKSIDGGKLPSMLFTITKENYKQISFIFFSMRKRALHLMSFLLSVLL